MMHCAEGDATPEHENEGSARLSDVDLEPIFEAMAAYENLARHVLMGARKELTKAQMDILIGLEFAGTMTMTQVAEHMAASKEQATRATAPLVEAGLVHRQRSEKSFRNIEVSLTEAGRAYLVDDKMHVKERLAQRLDSFSDEDVALLIKASKEALSVLKKQS